MFIPLHNKCNVSLLYESWKQRITEIWPAGSKISLTSYNLILQFHLLANVANSNQFSLTGALDPFINMQAEGLLLG